MIRQEQYEIWVQRNSHKWDMLGCFQDLDVATTIFKNRAAKSRLICITFEYGKMISQDLVAETPAAQKMPVASFEPAAFRRYIAAS